jgi:acyl-CoA thioesterase FadM
MHKEHYPYIFEYSLSNSELTQPYNHLHHADILKLLELTRLHFLVQIGQPLDGFLSLGLFWVIANLEVRYMREVQAGTISITCEKPKCTDKKLLMPQRIMNAKGKLAVDAEITLMLYCSNKKRAIGIPADVRAAFLEGPLKET